ncbi:hypothetical protein UA08_04161 [Talaromyces atroroseus]|uniref:Acyl-coenzyme A diphosphatase SCS3 n=1 Tax=Talaromyces atroroseus TaxID=1441469 RepID=A0A1Q5Q984_TALAT|nr:hypothetical protein UA08_04161 [Talaromyces atroroseus]OKL60632.1 hypothetical protein UA08_04161 [Talaromyces atroroseus]
MAVSRSGSPSSQGKGSNNPSPKTHPPVTVLAIYPLTLLLGSIYSVISPTARQSRDPKTIATTAEKQQQHTHPVNYFARKNNIFNLYFVKVGWAWTTIAFLTLLLTRPYYTKAPANLRGKRTAQALLRYCLVTGAWFLTTQWFFGPAIIDRTFVLTGGKCERLSSLSTGDVAWEGIKAILTAAACKAAGGSWMGGHDVSGHVFMLVLGSSFLAFEALGTSATSPFRSVAANASENTDENTINSNKDDSDGEIPSNSNLVLIYASRFVWTIIGLSWWMLFMTAIWFHTWVEKLSGLLISLAVVYITYILPRSLPSWADMIGIPGYEPAVRLE